MKFRIDNETITIEKNEVVIYFENKERMEQYKTQYENEMRTRYPTYSIKSFVTNKNSTIINQVEGKYDILEDIRKFQGQDIKCIGELIDFDKQMTKNESYMYKINFKVVNQNNMFEVVYFSKVKTIEEMFKNNKYFEIQGKVQYDRFYNQQLSRNDKFIGYEKINILAKNYGIKAITDINFNPKHRHTRPRKEFHLHTTYSNNDAIINSKDIQDAYDYGKLNTCAITDHGTTTGLLYLSQELKDCKVKLVGGIEAYMWDDYNEPSCTDAQRYHIILLLKTEDSTINYHGKDIKINPGIVKLNELITNSYMHSFSAPTVNKWWGKRPLIPKSVLNDPETHKHFLYGSACIMGEVSNQLAHGTPQKAIELAKFYDYLEVMPHKNNLFLIQEFPDKYTCLEDIYNISRQVYSIGSQLNKPVVFTSDAHVINAADREIRMIFKRSQIAMIKARSKEDPLEVYKDFTIDNQPYCYSYEEMVEELKVQGFKENEIQEIYNNEKLIDDQLIDLKNVTVVPKHLFIPYLDDVDIKELFPELIWKKANAFYNNNIPDKIKDRIIDELTKTQKKDFEILYYIAHLVVLKSEELGYPVISRGSAGSSVLSYLLDISENNPLDPHYYCKKCGFIEWVNTPLLGLDLPKKECPVCKAKMINDGSSIDFSSFVGLKGDKISDIDQNIASDIQGTIQQYVIDLFGKDFTSKGGTMRVYQEDSLKSTIISKLPRIKEHILHKDFDIDYVTKRLCGLKSGSGVHPRWSHGVSKRR